MFERLKKWWEKLPQKNERLHVHGEVQLTGRDKSGKVLFVKRLPNLITDARFDLICDTLGLTAQPSDITHMAIGSGAVGGAGDTTLTSEDQRELTVYAHVEGSKTCTFTSTFDTVVAATEYGLFNAGAAGDMLNTAGFDAITVDSLEIVTTITLS